MGERTIEARIIRDETRPAASVEKFHFTMRKSVAVARNGVTPP
jgi:hypothetical protein